MTGPLLASGAVGAGTEELVFSVLVQIVVVIAVSRVVVLAARRFLGQTDVAGEILAGLLLGPSLLGAISPSAMERIFTHRTSDVFSAIAQIGLVLLMFQIGMEFELRAKLAGAMKTIVAVSASGILVPFATGYLAAGWFWQQMAEPRPPELAFRLFFAIAMSITAIPILGRIFMELRLSHTRTAALVIGAASIDDVAGWLLLGAVSALVSSSFSAGALLLRAGGVAVYLVVVLRVLRPLVAGAIVRDMDRRGGELGQGAIALILLLVFVSAIVTSSLGVFAIIGGFTIGVALHGDRRFVEAWRSRVGPLVQGLLLPLFFAYTGLRTDIGTLGTAEARLQCVLVCLIAFAGKFGGAYAAARLCGEAPRAAVTIGVCMNTRALMELIVLNVGHDLGVLPGQMFTMLVIMAIASTYMATPLIRLLMAKERRPAAASPSPALSADQAI